MAFDGVVIANIVRDMKERLVEDNFSFDVECQCNITVSLFFGREQIKSCAGTEFLHAAA